MTAGAQEITLKFHHIWNTQAMASQRVITPWCDKVAAKSNNRLKCQIFPAMSLGGTPPQLVDQVRDGVTDLTITLAGDTAGRFPMMEVFELPFMIRSAESGAQAAWDYLNKHALKEFPGTKILAVWVHDQGYVHTREWPVRTLADLKAVVDRNSGMALSKQIGQIWDDSKAAGRKAAVERGNTFYTVPASELENWIAASASLYDEWVADIDKRGASGKALLQDARDLLQKYGP